MSEQKKVADEKMWFKTVIQEDDIRFYDVRNEPFEVYGLYNYRTEPQFKRLPDAIGQNVNDGVAQLYTNTAGGRVRFSTDSRYVAIRAVEPHIGWSANITLNGCAGFDLYVDDPETTGSQYYRTFTPPTDIKDDHRYESILKFPDRRLRYFTINFPLYSDVSELWIGLQEDAVLCEGMKYRKVLPVVYAGSSITQGASASRPGNAYQSIISRRLNLDFLNFGFSGSFKAEDTIVDYLNTLPMSAFVSDYDHNAPTAEHLKNTHYRMYERIREKHPDLPYVMITRPDVLNNEYSSKVLGDLGNGAVIRREIIFESYRKAIASGDRNVYFIDGNSFFVGEYQDCATIDSTHPNDYGMVRMADVIGCTIKNLNLK